MASKTTSVGPRPRQETTPIDDGGWWQGVADEPPSPPPGTEDQDGWTPVRKGRKGRKHDRVNANTDSPWNIAAPEGNSLWRMVVPEGCQDLLNWDGSWGPPPVDCTREKWQIPDNYIESWLDGISKALKDYLRPMPLEHTFQEIGGSRVRALFTNVLGSHDKAKTQVKEVIMGEIVPSYWKPEDLERQMNADTFWEYFRLEPPEAVEGNEGFSTNTIQPYWRFFPCQDAFYLRRIIDDSVNFADDHAEYTINLPEETMRETAARRADHGAQKHTEGYLARRNKRGGGGRRWPIRVDDRTPQWIRPKSDAPMEKATSHYTPAAHGGSEWDMAFPSLPMASQAAPGAAPPSPAITKPPAATSPRAHMPPQPPLHIHIRLAKDADIPQLARIYNHHIQHDTCTPHTHPFTPAAVRQHMREVRHADLPYLVALRSHTARVAGMAYAMDAQQGGASTLFRSTCEAEVFVSPEDRRRGVGSALLDVLTRLLDRRPLTSGLSLADMSVASPLRALSVRRVRCALIYRPFLSKRRPDCVLEWLGRKGWRQCGLVREVGFKKDGGEEEEVLDMAVLQRLSG